MRIILGLTGSVASVLYKKLIKELHAIGIVDVILTEKANHFFDIRDIRWIVEGQGGKVYTEDDEWRWYGKGDWYTDSNLQYSTIWEKNDSVLHIKLRDEATALVIAPCSANTLAKIANGICDNFLTSVVRAWDANRPLIIAPAMNNRIYPRHVLEKEIDEYKKKFIKKDKTYYVYIIKCGDRTYYTGYTTNLVRRFLQHQKGKGAKYTRGRAPFDMVYAEEYSTKSEAMKREYEIKQMTRKQKIKLIVA